MLRPRSLAVVAALFVTLSMAVSSYAQTTVVRPDVMNPASDAGIPALLTGANSLIRAEDMAILRFDSILDPSNGSDPSRLTPAAQSIIKNHMVAQQQVELAIRFLLANREEIIAGNNTFFNQIYGKPSGTKKFAVLAPVALPGTFSLVSPTLLQARPQGGGGGGGGGANQPRISVGTLLRPGDALFLIDPMSNPNNNNNNNNNNNIRRTTYPNQTTLGYVVNISGVIMGGLNNGGGGNQNNQNNQNTDFIIDPPATNVPTMRRLNNVTAWRIVRFEDRNDTIAYDQVLATFMAIRDALAGFDPGRLRTTQTRRDITYNRRYAPITSFYMPGDADFTQLDGLVDQRAPGFTADRLVRQAGFSLSDSHYHLDRLYDTANAQVTDYRSRPVTPLLWTQDDELPLQFANNTRVPNTGDEDRAFFRDRMTIFGDRDNFTGGNAVTPIDQYIGRAFLEEQIFHAGDFFDFGTIAANNLDQQFRDQRLPARGALQFTPAGPNTPAVPISDGLQPVPESGDPITEKTLRKWQMILSSFAEWSSDLDHVDLMNPNIRNVAALGLMNITGGTGAPELRSRDAENFAMFADLIGGAGGAGGIDFNRIEPLGKRGNAGFNPVVPSN
ncbi:MAG: hypothetical protein ACKV2Q_07100 [Planctomycetaceae bacterium]